MGGDVEHAAGDAQPAQGEAEAVAAPVDRNRRELGPKRAGRKERERYEKGSGRETTPSVTEHRHLSRILIRASAALGT